MIRKKALVLSLLTGAAMLAGAGASHATMFDVSADFSLASNPNGVWTYGSETTLGGSLTVYTVNSGCNIGGGLQGWCTSPLPENFNNATGATINTGTVTVPAHTAGFHPGQAGEFSVYRFTTPVAGTYTLSTSFFPDDIRPGGTDVHILDNGVSLFAHAVDAANSPTFNTILTLAAGDLIDFAVGFGADGNYFNDSTGIIATLTTGVSGVPEPSSLALLGVGLMALALTGRRRRLM